ncbi:uncharacterized protein BX663DRAFT_559557 [Cokeromyces recurvatus]|uniref:uncharacterized protein n=1 Tax=Cokeromyces recurvatus TaxID=90255 RepID=UPI00221F5E59|nr:uncharacterized protein BX663DRAFT_559557 [Cokeromyces recurvatus]KAI7904538.1 hypothetical protein BX663DRAFT_559557 [Cokeromyces recurvatus]
MPIPSYKKPNQIRIAAVSNYKLAQLTFAPPNNFTLRKTALIKNLVNIIYRHTPREYLSKLTRWQYFTPESLEDVTQKDIEKIIYRYSQTIFNTANILEKRLREHQFLFSDYPEQVYEEEDDQMNDNDNDQTEELIEASFYAALFSHPNSVFSNDSLDSVVDKEEKKKDITPVVLKVEEEIKPIPETIIDNQTEEPPSIPPRKLSTNNHDNTNTNRLSWLSDTGVSTNSTLASNLASELMTLFDMEFNVDLNLPDLRKLDGSTKNASSTSLHKVFTADQCNSDDDSDNNDYFADSLVLSLDQTLTSSSHIPDELIQRQSDHHLIHHSSSSYNEDVSTFNFISHSGPPPFIPIPQSLFHDFKYEDTYLSDEEKDIESKLKSKDSLGSLSLDHTQLPNRSTSLDYRNSLQSRFELSEDEISEASSNYFHDSLNSIELEEIQTQKHDHLDDAVDDDDDDDDDDAPPTFKGFLHALTKIKKTNSFNQSIQEDDLKERNGIQSGDSYSAIHHHHPSESLPNDGTSDSIDLQSIKTHKRKNSLQKLIDFIKSESSGDSKNSSTSVNGMQTETSTSTISKTTSNQYPFSSSSSASINNINFFSDDIHKKQLRSTPPSSSVALDSKGTMKRQGSYTISSIISDTSSFNWSDEVLQRPHTHEESGSVRSKMSNQSSRTLPTFIGDKGRKGEHNSPLNQRSKYTLPIGFFKKLATFSKKDKKPIRA